MAGLEMRFSRSSPFGTRRSRPTRTQESQPSTLDGLGAHNERFNSHFPYSVGSQAVAGFTRHRSHI